MGSLFKKIYFLLRKGQNNALEDYFTEIFAEIFEDKEMLVDFFKRFASTNLEDPSNISITTQITFDKLDHHEMASKPDLVIKFKDMGQNFIIFFENKLEASEGPQQLQRYAFHLKEYNSQGFNTFLFYVTRYYDPKENNDIIQLRWYMVYNWIKEHRNPFIDKVLKFMEEIKLNETRRFLPQDIIAIQEMNRLQRMMDECLEGLVDETMKNLFGQPIGWSNRNVQLRDYNRYFKSYTYDKNTWSTWIGCGFKLTDDEYPLISVLFQVSPKSNKRKETIKALNWFLNNEGRKNGWMDFDLEDDTKWSGIVCHKKILDILNHEDHIDAIQDFFIQKMKEMDTIKQKYPDLDWK